METLTRKTLPRSGFATGSAWLRWVRPPWIVLGLGLLAGSGGQAQGSLAELELRIHSPGQDVHLTFRSTGEATFSGRRPGWPMRGDQGARVGEDSLKLLEAVLPRQGAELEPPRPHQTGDSASMAWVCEGGARREVRFWLDDIPREVTALFLGAEAVAKRLSWIPTGPVPDGPAVVPEFYRFLYAISMDREEVPRVWKRLPFARVELAVTRHKYGSREEQPHFEFTLDANGTATWIGNSTMERPGKHTAELEVWDFGRICWFIEENKLVSQAGDYRIGALHGDDVSLRLLRPSGEVIEFEDNYNPAPIDVFALQAMIESLGLRLLWTEAE